MNIKALFFIQTFTLSTLLIFLTSCQTAEEQNRPNILIIHADQHRFDCLGAYGNKDIKTPNIDQLATQGIRFQNNFCTLPVCTPSRYSLLSGMYVHEHQGWTNHSTLNPAIQTFPDLLKAAGYKTAAVGKMHFAPTYLDVGFEKMILAEQDGPGRWDDDYHRMLKDKDLVDINDLEDQRREYRDNAAQEYWESIGSHQTNLPDSLYSTTWISNQALDMIDSWDVSGNLLMVGFIKPHHPFDPSAPWTNSYDPDKLSLLPGWIAESLEYDLEQHKGYFPNKDLSEESLRNVMAYYYATISHIDHEVGRMVKLLKEKGIYDNTMIIYTSDHGEHLGYHHQILKGGFLYESIMKVPLIIKYPKSENGGTVNDLLTSVVDIAPTILEQAGISIPPEMSGMALNDPSFKRDTVFAHTWLGKMAMARTNDKKLIFTPNGKSLFFDLENDPYEMNNLYGDDISDDISKLKQAIFRWQKGKAVNAENYLDENAPRIKQPNVPPLNDGHREVMIEYYKNKMEKR